MDGMRNSPPSQPNNEPQPPREPSPEQQAPVQQPLPQPAPATSIEQEPSTLPPVTPQPVNTDSGSSFAINNNSNKKKKWLPYAIIGGALALLLIAAGVVYAIYQQPENVLRQALMNAATAKTATAKGALTVDSSDADVDINYNLSSNGTDATFDMSMVFPLGAGSTEKGKIDAAMVFLKNGEFYVKADRLEELLKQSMGADSGNLDAEYETLIRKVDNKWIKVTSQDLEELGADTTEYDKFVKCYDALQGDFKNKANQDAVASLYAKNEFLKIGQKLKDETIDGRASFGYKVSPDPEKTYTFVKGVNELEPIKKYASCTGEKATPVERSDFNDINKDTTYEVWIDKWSHQFTRLKMSGDSEGSKGNLTFDPVFNKPVNIAAPTGNVVTLKELAEDPELQQFFGLLTMMSGAPSTQELNSQPNPSFNES